MKLLVGTLAIAAVLLLLVASGVFNADPSTSTAAGAPEDAHVAAVKPCTSGGSIYVAPDGRADAAATLDAPLDLATALSAKSPAKPCDTIWLRGGTYTGAFTSAVQGREGAPIVVRPHADERVTLDSAPLTAPALAVNGSHVWFRDFEITSSSPKRTSAQAEAWPTDLPRGTGITTRGTGVKFINLVIHDLARGIEIGSDAVEAEVYGSLIYYNGWDGPKTANGHGIETRNQVGRQVIANNIIFNQYSHGILALSSDTAHVDNLTLEQNTLFNNGIIGRSGFARDILIGGGTIAANPIVRENATYGGAQTFVGYGAGCSNGILTRNYLVGSSALLLEKCTATVTDNTLFGQYGFGTLPSLYADNTYLPSRPTGVVVRYFRNRYEPTRMHVVVYNWDKLGSVAIDLSKAGLTQGDQYEVRDAQNFLADPLIAQTMAGEKEVQIPMHDLKPARPVGVQTGPVHTAPEFAVFVVRKVAGAVDTRPQP